ncbi:MAG: hypothetical protein WBW02_21155 [Candidatus Sulfotelmatobacter sp.]
MPTHLQSASGTKSDDERSICLLFERGGWGDPLGAPRSSTTRGRVEFIQGFNLLKDCSHLRTDHFGVAGMESVPEIAVALA